MVDAFRNVGNVIRNAETVAAKENADLVTVPSIARIIVLGNMEPQLVFQLHQLLRNPEHRIGALHAFLLRFNVALIVADPEDLKQQSRECRKDNECQDVKAVADPEATSS